MSTVRVTRKKLPDPFAAEIAARIAARKAKEKREPVPAVPVGPEAPRVAAAAIRANPVLVVLEVR